ncbi:DUF5309 family protein [Escherichia coli]
MITLNTDKLEALKEGLTNSIYNITPNDTFILSKSKREKTNTPFFRWQIDNSDAVGFDSDANVINAKSYEGKDVGDRYGDLYTWKTQLGTGQTQSFRKSFSISSSVLNSKTFGRESEIEYQVSKGIKEIKNLMESVFCSRQEQDSTGMYQLTDGLFIQIADLDVDNFFLPSPDTKGDTAVHKKGKISFDKLDGIAKALYMSGSSANVILVNHYNSVAMNTAINEAVKANVTQLEIFDETAIEDGVKRHKQVKTFTDSLGRIWEIKYSRFVPRDLVYFLNPDDLTIRVLREPTITQLGKNGDFETWQIITECGLQLNNLFAAGVLEVTT